MDLSFRTIWWLALGGILMPLVWLVLNAFGLNPLTNGLGANPIEAINRFLGDWALRFLLIALAMTPIRIMTKKAWPIRLRRMLGLSAFFYAMAHLSSYVVLDQFFDWAAIWQDIVKRNFITVGMAVIIILTTLAVTSPASVAKRMGSKNWKRLHKLVYPAGALALLHFFWMIKADAREPIIYSGVFALLIGIRLMDKYRKARILQGT
ncbi:MAG: sulfoxide reductase heme-binding subunit YedZ [Rhodospirillaceae bacterium]|nr:sulfoxide reductase heme-binding subunit YedZ [Rhodospirillaceae bacterium]